MITTHEQTIVIGLAEMQVSADPSAVLTCLGLGSCIGLSAYDPFSKVGGMAHIVLPSSNGRTVEPSPKYADTAVPLLLGEMERLGANRSRIVAKISGGAQMSVSAGAGALFKTGEKNIGATVKALKESGVRLAAAETGGTKGRTLRLFVGSGKVTVSSAGAGSMEL
jgi:chemotaxis protein CheD